MSLYLGSEKVENVTAQITLPVEPSDDLPLANGTASAGTSKKFSRADHVHPMETVEATLVDLPSAEELGAIPAPTSGTAGQVLTKTASGQKWADVPVDENNVLLKNKNIVLPVLSSGKQWSGNIVYGNGKFVAISDDNRSDRMIAYSEDGIIWENGFSSSASVVLNSVAYGNGKFVATGGGMILYSTDGIEWNLATSYSWSVGPIIHGNNKFIAFGNSDSNKAAYSADGITWTEITLPISGSWLMTTYGNGKFIVGAMYSAQYLYSTDGITWTQGSLPASKGWRWAIFGSNKFIIASESQYIYSTDGINWSSVVSFPTSDLGNLIYADGKFFSCCPKKTNTILYSQDGINWTNKNINSELYFNYISYGNNKFFAYNYTKNIGAISTDGINWTSSIVYLQSPDGTDIHEQVRNVLQIPEPENEIFVCTVTGNNTNGYICDKTFAEISKAYNAGKICIAEYSGHICYLMDHQRAQVLETFYFSNISDATNSDSKRYKITINNYNNKTTVTQYSMSAIPTARKVTLTTSGWSNNQQTATCTGVSSSATSQEIRVMPADASKTSAYVSCGVSCVAQASDKLTFACDKVPTTAIDVYVVMQSLNFQS